MDTEAETVTAGDAREADRPLLIAAGAPSSSSSSSSAAAADRVSSDEQSTSGSGYHQAAPYAIGDHYTPATEFTRRRPMLAEQFDERTAVPLAELNNTVTCS